MKLVEVEGHTFIREKINCIGPLVGKNGNTFDFFFNVLCDGGNVSVAFELPDPNREKFSTELYLPARRERIQVAQQRYQELRDILLGHIE